MYGSDTIYVPTPDGNTLPWLDRSEYELYAREAARDSGKQPASDGLASDAGDQD